MKMVSLVLSLTFMSLALATGAPVVEVAPEVRVIGRRSPWPRSPELGETGHESVVADTAKVSGISQAVSQLPSVAVRRSGGEGAEPQFLIRGQDPQENRYFLEGVPLTDAEYQSSQLSAVPLEALTRIEVFPAGPPVALASDGVGGALHFRLATDGVSDQVRMRAGAYGLREAAASVPVLGPVRLTARALLSDEDFVYFDDNGTPFNPDDDRLERRAHNRFRRLSLLPMITGNRWSAFSLTSLAATEVPGPLALPSTADLRQGFQVVGVKGSAPLETNGEWTGQGWFRGDWQKLTDQQRTLSTNYSLDRSTSLGVGGRSKWEWNGAGLRWGVTTGLAWEGFQVSGAEGYAASRGRWQGTLGAQGERRWGTFVLTPGVLTAISHFPAASTRNFTSASPRLGWTWHVTHGVRLRGAASRHFRVPALAELHGSPSGLDPNGNLQPEIADKAEVGFDTDGKTPLGKGKISYTASAVWARDLVTYLPNAQWSRVAVNIGRSRVFTQELGADTELPLGFSLGGNAVWMTTENQSAVAYWQGKELPYRPRWRGETRVGWRSGKFRLGYQATVWGELYEDLVNAKRREALVEHGLEAALETSSWGDWRVEAANLGDVLTVDSAVGAFRTVENTTGYLGYPAPGRRIYFSWRYAL